MTGRESVLDWVFPRTVQGAAPNLDLAGHLPTLSVSGTIRTETGKGTYQQAHAEV